jgi:hypothetical protein
MKCWYEPATGFRVGDGLFKKLLIVERFACAPVDEKARFA